MSDLLSLLIILGQMTTSKSFFFFYDILYKKCINKYNMNIILYKNRLR